MTARNSFLTLKLVLAFSTDLVYDIINYYYLWFHYLHGYPDSNDFSLVLRLSDNKSSSVCVFFTTNLGLIFKRVVSLRIN